MRNFAIIRSVDAPRHISQEQLHAYTDRVVSSMRQAGKRVPPILIMHVSESVAEIVGVGRTGVIRHNCNSVPELGCYYEIWLVGQAVFADYVLALQGVIDDFHTAEVLPVPAAMPC